MPWPSSGYRDLTLKLRYDIQLFFSVAGLRSTSVLAHDLGLPPSIDSDWLQLTARDWSERNFRGWDAIVFPDEILRSTAEVFDRVGEQSGSEARLDLARAFDDGFDSEVAWVDSIHGWLRTFRQLARGEGLEGIDQSQRGAIGGAVQRWVDYDSRISMIPSEVGKAADASDVASLARYDEAYGRVPGTCAVLLDVVERIDVLRTLSELRPGLDPSAFAALQRAAAVHDRRAILVPESSPPGESRVLTKLQSVVT